ncbi:MAG TPA: acetyl-CoA carboxylase biotin carboxyl carrier protein [Polyangiaceae bacterium]|jgi:acetyl-CoA carboxylase biotin carboxyl carrier protein|nr:acetyl-CoA carboxylase biotin carboxyl carrier protein [Polyangiaceae bacterium]
MQIALEQLEALLKTLEDKKVAEFEYEDEKVRLRIALGRPPMVAVAPAPVAAAAPIAAAGSATSAASAADDPSITYVTSPFVGTFYRAPSPEADNFTDVGASVKKGQTLCIIEAMKLMNEIESEAAGTIVEILVENGKSVEFGQKLFKLKKN